MRAAAALPRDLFADRSVFITGGGSGINLGIAVAFAELGATVGLCGRSADRLEGAKQVLIEAAATSAAGARDAAARVVTAVADVRDYEALEAALEKTRDAGGRPISTLVAGAAGNFMAPAHKISANGFRTVIDIDLQGAFNASRAAFEQLSESGGGGAAGGGSSIIFVGAGQAFQPFAMQVHVGAAKAGIDSMMANLALEWGRFGIRSNTVCPGPIAGTEGMERLGPPPGHPLYEKLLGTIPAGRYGEKDEVANAAVFLASPMASYITGTVLRVDGGQNLPGTGNFTDIMGQYMGEQAAAAKTL